MLGLLKTLFGTKHDKEVKLMRPIVEEINNIYEQMHKLSDDEIKAKTIEFKELVKKNTAELEAEKEEWQNKLITESLSASENADVNEKIKKLDKDIFEVANQTLNEILPEAFAVVKQACKRLTESKHTYVYAGHESLWEMVPYDVQLMGGITLHQGRISEMATGEGKTLVAVLPLYLNALAGKGAHLVTVNDYLAQRDADWMRPVYEFLGLSVGSILSNMEPEERKESYNNDITYGTNNEFGFDYLRDNMVIDAEQMVQRPHWFAIVDEVDSVLIDEARTPLIISGPVAQSDQRFEEMNPIVKRMVEAQNRLVNEIVAEASQLIDKTDKESKSRLGDLILRGYHGMPKHKRLAKLLQEPESQKLLRETELFYMRDKSAKMHEIDDELFYTIDEKNHQVDITEKGRILLTQGQADPDVFLIPDIAAEQSAIEGNEALSKEEKQKLVDRSNMVFAERSDRIHTISQLLRAYSLYEKDIEYVIQDGKIMIVDEFTGRILDGRRYSEGLHQAIEAKENVKVERDTQTLATITLQNYFRLYKKLAGMTGTADTEAGEFEKIYSLEVVVVPTNRPMQRKDEEDLIYRTKREKFNAIVEQVQVEMNAGRAVLVGTASVDVSELLSKMLKRANIPHNVLNAKQHAKEADIIALAGRKGAITIATNMAGRGTDIKLDPEVKKNGGLAIIGSERHDARRIDRQLRGRAGRQGDPGTSQFYISLEDDLMRLFGGERIAGIMQRLKVPEGEPIQHSMITKSVERAQKKVEENNFGIRKRLLEYDDVMNMQREVIYTRRKAALRGERLKGEFFDYIEEMAADWYDQFHEEKRLTELKNAVRAALLSDPKIEESEFEAMSQDECIQRIVDAANEFYSRKEEMLGVEFTSKLEQIAALQTIDDKWREHLREMDDLKDGIHLRSYGQKDPLLEYKQESFELFKNLIREINKESVTMAFKFFPQIVDRRTMQDDAPPHAFAARRPAPAPSGSRPKQNNTSVSSGGMTFSHPSTSAPSFVYSGGSSAPEPPKGNNPEGEVTRPIRNSEKKIGRNDPCPCGSGKKYKSCCGKHEEELD
jgi:preprotein translocase subunit SecA